MYLSWVSPEVQLHYTSSFSPLARTRIDLGLRRKRDPTGRMLHLNSAPLITLQRVLTNVRVNRFITFDSNVILLVHLKQVAPPSSIQCTLLAILEPSAKA